MNENVIEVRNLVKYFDGRCVLDGINLNVKHGCIYGLLGRKENRFKKMDKLVYFKIIDRE